MVPCEFFLLSVILRKAGMNDKWTFDGKGLGMPWALQPLLGLQSEHRIARQTFCPDWL